MNKANYELKKKSWIKDRRRSETQSLQLRARKRNLAQRIMRHRDHVHVGAKVISLDGFGGGGGNPQASV